MGSSTLPGAGRPRVGISQCLLGDEVRYDAGHKRDALLLETIGRYVEWVPVCPEVEVGMGVPREPIQLVAAADGVASGEHRVRLLGVSSQRDWTESMDAWCRDRVRELSAAGLSGYVFKQDSPSCGLDVRIASSDAAARSGPGLFAQALTDAMPDLPVEEEGRLHDARVRERFLERVFARQRGLASGAGGQTALRTIEIARVVDSCARAAHDVAAVEEPLEIRVNDASFAVIMRTPGADRELAAGFLLSERVVSGADDLGVIRHCVDPDGVHAPNVVNVTLTRAVTRPPAQRSVTSACGVCGRRTIDDLMEEIEPLPSSWRVPARLIETLPGALRARQDAFDATGGLHAAGLFDRDGQLVASAEDVGRHNAVDKVIGSQLLMERMPLDERLLFVSGRAGYEIVQKALVARIPIVASVSAPSSLAIELARDAGLTLVGFVRDATFNIYTGAERIDVS